MTSAPSVPQNPFNVTKATDLTDAEIESTWVDLPVKGGFKTLLSPLGSMPVIIVGGKGLGRTHLMRHYSSSLQLVRHGGDPKGIVKDRYLGVYFRASGLNSSRFAGKGISEEAWEALFGYYFELWLAQHTLMAVCALEPLTTASERAKIASGAGALFDSPLSHSPSDLNDLAAILNRLQRDIDSAVNNAAMTRTLEVQVSASPGKLVFGLPKLITSSTSKLRNLRFLYLIDELENFTAAQQEYIQTLLREKELPCSFLIGSRLHGLRTYRTATGEENKRGSEFELLHLDRDVYQADLRSYGQFCRRLVAQRIIEAGYRDSSTQDLAESLGDYFATPKSDRLGRSDTAFVLRSNRSADRPYFEKIRRAFRDNLPEVPAEEVVQLLRFPEFPLIEKTAVFMLYQAWAAKRPVLHAAKGIRRDAQNYIKGGSGGAFGRRLSHFRLDMMAQLLREYEQEQRYVGFEAFVTMSAGLPRTLMVILKCVFRWSVFLGESPFTDLRSISEEAQRRGVREASEWFFENAPSGGIDGRNSQEAVDRLANLLRTLRFSSKPVESSLVAFSVDLASLTGEALHVLQKCEAFSFLLPIPPGHTDRNSGRLLPKFQLHPMLGPKWGLPISRRGTLTLSAKEANAIFDPNSPPADYSAAVRAREKRVEPPFETRTRTSSGVQATLLD